MPEEVTLEETERREGLTEQLASKVEEAGVFGSNVVKMRVDSQNRMIIRYSDDTTSHVQP